MEASSTIHQLAHAILGAHEPCERLSGCPYRPVFINPENDQEFFVITLDRAHAWAREIQRRPHEVTIHIPPRSPLF
ncbi:uncharacterized protein PGTG_09955 [Puccinia graminis f. sp. tritici CRL 75-36-700-3]|uniref:Uncharacterized protein n=1 Tax=Puccinia graminis f. sp. tritici (strain CRL 75-36-700-3 / race SCCL) TaxID=418459 RepID=E3KFG0_PUCGT|nr:uncharacterized protein PGTG_09955 [Puccinia graminis f. sp. tritici CRL 75-36-700-3]EFP82987.2 hypothetical protein PGTG_09955 [Puccinia graminis f. sp. tritici CRL 75-36-700-3]